MMEFAQLRIYNTLTRKVEEFKPIHGKRIFMFVCGPTVYDFSHIGHARLFVFYDTVVKWLRKSGYSVFYIVNITDVDDKIINRAKEENIHPLELARKYEEEFIKDMESLNVTSPNLYPRTSDYLPEIFWQIKVLLEKGIAYETPTGIYFDITKFKDYGKLSRRKPEDLRVHRIEPDPNKRNPGDFALWKIRPREEFGWDSPWGYGRPGWHIEDTAITLRHFGEQYDIHGGAIELIFPHHEAEIAQAESVTGVKPFVRYWVHVGLLTVDGAKMSKSLGNVITVRDALRKYSANALRILFLKTHYRTPIDFKWEMLEDAAKVSSRIESAYHRLNQLDEEDTEKGAELLTRARTLWEEFRDAMNNDFNTPVALSKLIGLASAINDYTNTNKSIGSKVLQEVKKIFLGMSYVMGLSFREARIEEGMVKELIGTIVWVRGELRKQKLWSLSDEIRERLRKLGIELHDTAEGTRWVLRKSRGS